MTVAEALAGCGLDAREARLLLAASCGFSQASVLAYPERDLEPESERSFLAAAARRRAGEPLAYILGVKEFYGLPLAVNPAVLIPRPETELLIDLALERGPSSLLDLGTGSGAIALAIRRRLPATRVVAVEASAAALVVARRNAVKLGLEVEFRHGLWFEPVAGMRFDMVVSNPPYVAGGDPHLGQGDLRFEPLAALVAGEDGLDAIRAIVAGAAAHLVPGGWLMLEHGLGQDRAVRELMDAAGLEAIESSPTSRVLHGSRWHG